MSAASQKIPPTKPRKDRERDRKEKIPPVAERLKTVVRRLPANLPEDVFWESVVDWVTEETVTWKTFYPGKPRKRLNKENIPSRAYIAFKTEEQLALFGREYDGHLFRDRAGNESYAIVEYAPYQKVPPERKKPDARNATIEQDEEYISFLASLNAPPPAEPSSLEALIAANQPAPQPTTTPLLEALKAQKQAIKDREAILRNHAHHKEPIILAANRKEDPKKKVAPGPKAPEPASVGRKAGKKGAPASTAAPLPQKVQGSSNAAKSLNIPGPSNGAPRPPKAAKTKVISPTKVVSGPAKVVAPPVSEGPSSAGPPSVDVPAVQTGPTPAANPPPRRRPVIGVASRHFEAALSGAGVNPSLGERKSRREKEQDGQKETAGSGASGAPPAVSDAKPAPPSPKRDRGARPTKDVAMGSAIPTVTILQSLPRIDDPPTQGEASAPSQTNIPSGQAAGGGGRGRRGRGRGRGGPHPGAPVRGG